MATDNGRMPVTLRLPKKLLEQIDEIRAAEPISTSRNNWIAETLVKRIQEERPSKERRNVAQ